MIRITNLSIPFDQADEMVLKQLLTTLRITEEELLSWKIKRRSLDARTNRQLRKVYTVIAEVKNEESLSELIHKNGNIRYWEVSSYRPPAIKRNNIPEQPLVIGAGPAGIFAALVLAQSGCRPLLLERGKPVNERTRDVREFWNSGELDEESNVQFGEGGAGTFSDGKLGSRIKDKFGRRGKILKDLVAAGAPSDILIDSNPHIGTSNLVKIVAGLRDRIQNLGGAYRFSSKVVDLLIEGDQLRGVMLASGEEIYSNAVILAVGHSARDTFRMLADRGVKISPKPFSAGVRIEHPQILIDRNQYGKQAGHPALGAAEYQLSFSTKGGRTAYSFCMCPGGSVIGASSELGGVVTNGMSQYARSGKNANSAIVAEVYPGDFSNQPLGGIQLQRNWEQAAFQVGGGNYQAPAQLVGDFLMRKASSTAGSVQPTYLPGVKFTDLRQVLPDYLTDAIAEALPVFDRKISGFAREDAVLTGVETRTSCPLRIVRGKDFQSVSLRGMYPAGEGSGYAGGIMSSAIDGIKAAEQILVR